MTPNTGFYLTGITIPVSFYTIESGRNYNIKSIIGDPHYHCRSIPEGNYNTITLNQAIFIAMNTAYLQTNGDYPINFNSRLDYNNIIILHHYFTDQRSW